MDEYYSVIQFLPEPLRTELKAMPPERAARVQEIRDKLSEDAQAKGADMIARAKAAAAMKKRNILQAQESQLIDGVF